jgi:hypothetical protein
MKTEPKVVSDSKTNCIYLASKINKTIGKYVAKIETVGTWRMFRTNNLELLKEIISKNQR